MLDAVVLHRNHQLVTWLRTLHDMQTCCVTLLRVATIRALCSFMVQAGAVLVHIKAVAKR